METLARDSYNHKIKLLPEHIIDQIKAGEIIERPSYVIKELLENSIDANATEISITIMDNGLKLIQVSDNGDGINFPDLPYAFLRHATSKIETFEDVFKLNSYGFRGEALASIASIARVTCESTPRSNPHEGGKLTIISGKVENHLKIKGESKDCGTTISVHDLFFNTPVRLKFLKSKTTEKNQLKKIVESFLINSPHVAFTVKWDQEDKIYFESVATKHERIYQILTKGNRKGSIDKSTLEKADLEYENTKIEAYLSFSKKTEYLFINSRLILDKQLLQYIHFQLTKLFPQSSEISYFIFLTIPSSEIDVNVHPNKTVVKFSDQNLVYSLISAVLKKFQVKPLTASPIEPLSDTSSEKPTATTNNLAHFNYEEFYFIAPSYLINFKTFLTHFFTVNLFSKPIKNEEELQPLFVAEPIQIPQKNLDLHLPYFKNHGFEMERINQDFIILKTLPSSLNNSPAILKLLSSYLTFLNENLTSKNLAKLTKEFFDNSDVTNPDLFNDFYQLIPMTNSPFVKTFSKKELQQFFI